jgi:hypothetical protein
MRVVRFFAPAHRFLAVANAPEKFLPATLKPGRAPGFSRHRNGD